MQVILSLNRTIKYMKYGMDVYQYPRRKIVYRMTIRIGGGGGGEGEQRGWQLLFTP